MTTLSGDLWKADTKPTNCRVQRTLAEELGNAFSFGLERTPGYDIEFSLRRILEIAQRALSPGINDLTTALYCLDRLGEALGLLADRRIPSDRIMDQDIEPRVVFEPVKFSDLACSAFAAIARYRITFFKGSLASSVAVDEIYIEDL